MRSKTKFNNRYRQLVGVFLLSFLLIAGAFTIFPVIGNKAKTLKWAEWTGFGEDTTRSESVETKTETGKKTVTTQFQSGKTLWDVLELAGTLAIPVLLTILGIWFQQREQKQAEKQAQTEKDQAEKKAQTEKDIANENLRDEALQAYIDRLSELLLDRNLIHSDDNDPVRDVARTRTLTILRRLGNDSERKARVLHFLYDAGLLEIKPVPLINLKDADFRAADLLRANLIGANLITANLISANLSGADLSDADLSGANLNRANLRGADLNRANLRGANLSFADLSGAMLFNTDFSRADLTGADLSEASFGGANLNRADLTGADLSEASFGGANLNRANLRGANLSLAYLSDADLSFAKLSSADLSSADLRRADLFVADLSGADLSGAALEDANLIGVDNLTPEQVKKAYNWEKGKYSKEFCLQLGLPPEFTK